MTTTLARFQAILWFLAMAPATGPPAVAQVKTTATKSLTIQAGGPRLGETGTRYFNVEGVRKERYASFGVLILEVPKGASQAGDIEKMRLQLFQSIARFSQHGKLRFFLAEPRDGGTESHAGLKFDAGSSGGVGKDAFKAMHPLGSGTFKKVETGHADTFELKANGGGKRFLRDRIKASGSILIVVVPDDEEVAATYFGAGDEPEANRPSLGIDVALAK
jgi:hypothetical protein